MLSRMYCCTASTIRMKNKALNRRPTSYSRQSRLTGFQTMEKAYRFLKLCRRRRFHKSLQAGRSIRWSRSIFTVRRKLNLCETMLNKVVPELRLSHGFPWLSMFFSKPWRPGAVVVILRFVGKNSKYQER